jgi:hypothetical protein
MAVHGALAFAREKMMFKRRLIDFREPVWRDAELRRSSNRLDEVISGGCLIHVVGLNHCSRRTNSISSVTGIGRNPPRASYTKRRTKISESP